MLMNMLIWVCGMDILREKYIASDRVYEEWHPLGCYAMWLLVRTDVSEELSSSFIRVTRIGELGTTLAAFTACISC
jgi:hypothetical protein